MADAVELTFRPIYMEDIASTKVPTGDNATVEVLGSGSQSLQKVPLTLLTQLVSAADDSAAATGGVLVGEVYYNTTRTRLRTRMS